MISPSLQARLRQIPGVEKLLEHPRLAFFFNQLPRPFVAEIIRQGLSEFRTILATNEYDFQPEQLIDYLATRLTAKIRQSLQAVINGTGVILHTNFGRAPLSDVVVSALAIAARNYVNLEYRLDLGERGGRGEFAEDLFKQLLGSEAVAIVNNNAGAVLLALAALAKGKEVIISRGELVQIGGGFRIPEILTSSGAILIEVGTTNQTTLTDYRQAINANTGLILKVHQSNFVQIGFVHSVPIADLVQVGHNHGLLVVEDLGSGAVIDTAQFGLRSEPTVARTLATGCDLVCFSGDKLLGGPQAGILAGRKELIAQLKNHPLYRVLRVDKLTYTAIEQIAKIYLCGEEKEKIPVWQMIATSVAMLQKRGEQIIESLAVAKISASLETCTSTIGGGSLPGETLPSMGVGLLLEQPPQDLARQFRLLSPPVLGRIEHEHFLIDLRTVFPYQDTELIAAIKKVVNSR